MRIDQALDLRHSAITIQEDVRQSCGLSKLYNIQQSTTCFVVKSSRKAIDQALDLGHSAITIQEDIRQSYRLSKLYNVQQSATCFVVKSSRKAKSVRQLLERSTALFLLLLPPCRSLERTAAN